MNTKDDMGEWDTKSAGNHCVRCVRSSLAFTAIDCTVDFNGISWSLARWHCQACAAHVKTTIKFMWRFELVFSLSLSFSSWTWCQRINVFVRKVSPIQSTDFIRTKKKKNGKHIIVEKTQRTCKKVLFRFFFKRFSVCPLTKREKKNSFLVVYGWVVCRYDIIWSK